MRYYPHNKGLFILRKQVPKHFPGRRMRDSKAYYGQGAWGEYVSQAGRISGFSFGYDVFNIIVQTSLFCKRLSPGVSIMYMLKGSFAISNSAQVLKNGNCYICYLPRGETNYLLEEGHQCCFSLVFRVGNLNILAPNIEKLQTFKDDIQQAPENSRLLFAGAITKNARRIIDAFCSNEQESTERELMLGAYARTLLSIIPELLRKNTPEKPPDVTRKALSEFIDQHLDSSLTISVMARAFALNKAKTKKIFRKLFNTTVHEYILSRRLEHSRRLLVETGDSVYIISIKTGFWDASHFVKCFKAAYGITPLLYRKQYN
ncbi:MAG: AraC family transcriptional regulator [Agriterribacter sp.]